MLAPENIPSRTMSNDEASAVVQTRLEEGEYERLRRVATENDLSLQDALRKAVREYVNRHGKHDPDDPFFSKPSKDPTADSSITAKKADQYLY
ncbi:hypothetical protein [Halorhabdus tiamatea]|uniref:hypothetical protein n=1 Tax=Halorhabdus tiamatea TaxID=430914 RepID=UPI001FCBAE66|nr:hypothetical protein [Halorhabdus tiamatea]